MPSTDASVTLELLRHGEIHVEGRLVSASNATLYCRVIHEGDEAVCVYKPVQGERPLWDFPDGTLGRREVAAYLVSEAAGWRLVPPTVWRDGPFGPGMVQQWVDSDESVDVVELIRGSDERLRPVAVFDAVINNGDRKGGHLLPTTDGRVLGIDHGVAFAVEPKLRTLLWNWESQPLPSGQVQLLRRLTDEVASGQLGRRLLALLSVDEVAALQARVAALLTTGVHPSPSPDWPPIPWPPF